MSYQWLQMRITEEQERRQRESHIHERLPRALDELAETLLECIEAYSEAFGPESAELQLIGSGIRIIVRDRLNDRWQEASRVEIESDLELPGFRIDRAGETFQIEVGLLPSDKVFYRDREQDQFLTIEDLTRRILDRALFPKLGA